MTEIETRVVAAWRRAEIDLGIRFSTPFCHALADGRICECPGLIHCFGSPLGTVIAVLGQPSESEAMPSREDGYHFSILGEMYGQFERELFIETLNDWQYYGPVSERPTWYAG